jgi:hypothetical protein
MKKKDKSIGETAYDKCIKVLNDTPAHVDIAVCAALDELTAERDNALNALRQCDFYLDEFAIGACSVPPRASPLDVPKGVDSATSVLRVRLAHMERVSYMLRKALETLYEECGQKTLVCDKLVIDALSHEEI